MPYNGEKYERMVYKYSKLEWYHTFTAVQLSFFEVNKNAFQNDQMPQVTTNWTTVILWCNFPDCYRNSIWRTIDQFTTWNFSHLEVTNWSIIVIKVQMSQIKLPISNFQHLESLANVSTNYVLIQSPLAQLQLVVTQCLFHASTISDHAQLRPESPSYSNSSLPWRYEILKYSAILE